MKLLGSLASPYVRKVRIVMAEKKLDYSLVLDNVWAPETTVPVSLCSPMIRMRLTPIWLVKPRRTCRPPL